MYEKKEIRCRVVCYIFIIATLLCLLLGVCTLRTVKENVWYTSKNYVALYIYKYHKLPDNFITKEEASNIKDGTAKKKYNIGGDTFFNREGHLPGNNSYIECDIYTRGSSISSRGAERIVFTKDGSKVYYTSDHYDSFTLITKWSINRTSYSMFVIVGVLAATQIVVVIYSTAKKDKFKVNVFDQLIVSLEVIGVVLLLVVLSPIAVVLWIVDTVRQKQLSRNAGLDTN